MKVTNRIISNNETVGYLVEDDAYVLPMCSRSLYTSLYIDGLIDSGYKYFNYNADEIELAGVKISTLPGVELGTLDELEWNASIDLASQDALTDVEASRYYEYREVKAIEFKREESYEINTREEFITYINNQACLFSNTAYSNDVRPINYLVNPDALFTIDEIREDRNINRYLNILQKRRTFRNYEAYQWLIGWLVEQGVLNTKTPTMAEFLSAYYAWGPCGIHDKCIDVQVKLNVDGVFSFVDDPLSDNDPETRMVSNRQDSPGFVDDKGNLGYINFKENINGITDVAEFGRNRLAIKSQMALNDLLRNKQQSKYRFINKVGVSDVSDRVYIKLLSESNYTYVYKASHNKLWLGLATSAASSNIISTTANFSVASIMPGLYIPLNMLNNNNDYYLWNLAAIKAADLVRQRTIDSKYKSTSEFLLSDGVTPISAVNMVAYSISNNKGSVNSRYQLTDKEDSMYDAMDLYMNEIPDYILDAFMLSREDIDNSVETFLSIADVDELNDRRELMSLGLISQGSEEFDVTFKDYKSQKGKDANAISSLQAILGRASNYIDAIDYHTKLRFISDMFNIGLSVDNFGDGKLKDLDFSLVNSVEVLLTITYMECGNDYARAISYIKNIEQDSNVNILQYFKMRDAASIGCDIDFANYRKIRAGIQTWTWAYCSKVFREISNKPVEQQRPYLMEIVIVDNENKSGGARIREMMTERVEEAIDKLPLATIPFSSDNPMWSEMTCAKASAAYIASELFFRIIGNAVRLTNNADGTVYISVPVDNNEIKVQFSNEDLAIIKSFDVSANRRYITLYDFCKHEYTMHVRGGAFSFHLVNASVTPWSVKPKQGYSIKSYPFFANYYKGKILDGAYGAGYYNNCCQSGCTVVTPLSTIYTSKFIPVIASEEMAYITSEAKEVESATRPEDLYMYLGARTSEYINTYVKRWGLERARVNAGGKKLVSMPLKQDVLYEQLPESVSSGKSSASIEYCDSTFDDRAVGKDNAIITLTANTELQFNGNESAKKAVTRVSINNPNVISLLGFEEILNGTIISEAVVVSSNWLTLSDYTKILLTDMSDEQVRDLVDRGILVPLNSSSYYIKAVNGEYIVEV